MRLVAFVGVLIASRAALAEPGPCDVHVLRAPDKARTAIEMRIRAEPTCETSLVVRVVKTGRKLYVLAHTPNGHVYELVARDARTAADLIALWASSREPATAAATAVVLAPPAIAPPPIAASPAEPVEPALVRPPGVATATELAAESIDGRPAARHVAGKWLSIGGILGDDVAGARAELDVLDRGGWSGGLAFEASQMRMTFDAPSGALFDFVDLRAVATVGYTLGRGAWRLRVHAGFGVVHSQMDGYVYDGPVMTTVSTDGVYAIGEASLQLTRALGARWAFAAGPLATLYSQRYLRDDGVEVGSRDYDISLVGGLRRQL